MFPSSSGSPARRSRATPSWPARTACRPIILKTLGARNVVTTEEEWPLVGWETIAAANPAVIVVVKMDRRRYAADDIGREAEFPRDGSGHEQARRRQEQAHRRDGRRAMNPTIRTIDGIETLANGIKCFGLAQ